MTSTVARASVIAALSTCSLLVPLSGPAAAAAVATVVFVGSFVVRGGRLFELLSLAPDRADGYLLSVALFVLAGVTLGAIAGATALGWPAVVGALLLVGYGTLAARLARPVFGDAVAAAAFCVGGGLAAVAGQAITHGLEGGAVSDALPEFTVLAASGALLAAICHERLPRYDDPLVLVALGLVFWLLSELEPAIGGWELAAAIAVMALLGAAAYLLETASVAGMLAGTLFGLVTIVFGGWGWFAVLIAFFGIGGFASKYRYDEKRRRGVAEGNDGARGSANVVSNSAVALAAVLGYAASDAGLLTASADLFAFAFAGAVATALSDTLSSEIGGVFDRPRLITTLEPVEPGTDGAITWQGELAGLTGAIVVAAITAALLPAVGATGFAVIVLAGVSGMTVDSLLGATIEGETVGNQTVNFLATLAGATVAALLIGPAGL